ncbi:hypothetical protein [Actinoplanes regularis]|uniref:hypothetical protein n=1 Tax=Actinoplanes regularis TaxID=52697 RepID=UPI0024A1B120|nr:hypothetical protein [Actinoplanes regularis]GLW34471.1 hypothetical protein Areg01_74080 [Actinoplanes regularis]
MSTSPEENDVTDPSTRTVEQLQTNDYIRTTETTQDGRTRPIGGYVADRTDTTITLSAYPDGEGLTQTLTVPPGTTVTLTVGPAIEDVIVWRHRSTGTPETDPSPEALAAAEFIRDRELAHRIRERISEVNAAATTLTVGMSRLALLSPLAQAQLRVAVEDHGPGIIRNPMFRPDQLGRIDYSPVGRDVTEGHLKDLDARYGFRLIWEAVDEYARQAHEHEQILTRTPQQVTEYAEYRARMCAEHADAAGVALTAGDFNTAYDRLDQGQLTDPGYRHRTRQYSWDDLRTAVARRELAAAPDTTTTKGDDQNRAARDATQPRPPGAIMDADQRRIVVAVEDLAPGLVSEVGRDPRSLADQIITDRLHRLAGRYGHDIIADAIAAVISDAELGDRWPQLLRARAEARATELATQNAAAMAMIEQGDHRGTTIALERIYALDPDYLAEGANLADLRAEGGGLAALRAYLQAAADRNPLVDGPISVATSEGPAADSAKPEEDPPAAADGDDAPAPDDELPAPPPVATSGALAEFTALEQARIRVKVEDRAGEYASSPLIGRNPETIGRYIGKGDSLNDIAPGDRWKRVAAAAREILADRPDLMDLDTAQQREAFAAERAAGVTKVLAAADVAYQDGDYQQTLDLIDRGQLLDPTHRPYGDDTWPALREFVADKQREAASPSATDAGEASMGGSALPEPAPTVSMRDHPDQTAPVDLPAANETRESANATADAGAEAETAVAAARAAARPATANSSPQPQAIPGLDAEQRMLARVPADAVRTEPDGTVTVLARHVATGTWVEATGLTIGDRQILTANGYVREANPLHGGYGGWAPGAMVIVDLVQQWPPASDAAVITLQVEMDGRVRPVPTPPGLPPVDPDRPLLRMPTERQVLAARDILGLRVEVYDGPANPLWRVEGIDEKLHGEIAWRLFGGDYNSWEGRIGPVFKQEWIDQAVAEDRYRPDALADQHAVAATPTPGAVPATDQQPSLITFAASAPALAAADHHEQPGTAISGLSRSAPYPAEPGHHVEGPTDALTEDAVTQVLPADPPRTDPEVLPHPVGSTPMDYQVDAANRLLNTATDTIDLAWAAGAILIHPEALPHLLTNPAAVFRLGADLVRADQVVPLHAGTGPQRYLHVDTGGRALAVLTQVTATSDGYVPAGPPMLSVPTAELEQLLAAVPTLLVARVHAAAARLSALEQQHAAATTSQRLRDPDGNDAWHRWRPAYQLQRAQIIRELHHAAATVWRTMRPGAPGREYENQLLQQAVDALPDNVIDHDEQGNPTVLLAHAARDVYGTVTGTDVHGAALTATGYLTDVTQYQGHTELTVRLAHELASDPLRADMLVRASLDARITVLPRPGEHDIDTSRSVLALPHVEQILATRDQLGWSIEVSERVVGGHRFPVWTLGDDEAPTSVIDLIRGGYSGSDRSAWRADFARRWIDQATAVGTYRPVGVLDAGGRLVPPPASDAGRPGRSGTTAPTVMADDPDEDDEAEVPGDDPGDLDTLFSIAAADGAPAEGRTTPLASVHTRVQATRFISEPGQYGPYGDFTGTPCRWDGFPNGSVLVPSRKQQDTARGYLVRLDSWTGGIRVDGRTNTGYGQKPVWLAFIAPLPDIPAIGPDVQMLTMPMEATFTALPEPADTLPHAAWPWRWRNKSRTERAHTILAAEQPADDDLLWAAATVLLHHPEQITAVLAGADPLTTGEPQVDITGNAGRQLTADPGTGLVRLTDGAGTTIAEIAGTDIAALLHHVREHLPGTHSRLTTALRRLESAQQRAERAAQARRDGADPDAPTDRAAQLACRAADAAVTEAVAELWNTAAIHAATIADTRVPAAADPHAARFAAAVEQLQPATGDLPRLGEAPVDELCRGAYVQVTGLLADGRTATLTGYLLTVEHHYSGWAGWVPADHPLVTLAGQPDALTGVEVAVAADHRGVVLAPPPGMPASTQPWQLPTRHEQVVTLLALLGDNPEQIDGPDGPMWRLPGEKDPWTATTMLNWLASGETNHPVPVLWQTHIDDAVTQGRWTGPDPTGPTPLHRTPLGAYGTITGLVDGTPHTITGELRQITAGPHRTRLFDTADVQLRVSDEQAAAVGVTGPRRLITVQAPVTGATFTITGRPGADATTPVAHTHYVIFNRLGGGSKYGRNFEQAMSFARHIEAALPISPAVAIATPNPGLEFEGWVVEVAHPHTDMDGLQSLREQIQAIAEEEFGGVYDWSDGAELPDPDVDPIAELDAALHRHVVAGPEPRDAVDTDVPAPVTDTMVGADRPDLGSPAPVEPDAEAEIPGLRTHYLWFRGHGGGDRYGANYQQAAACAVDLERMLPGTTVTLLDPYGGQIDGWVLTVIHRDSDSRPLSELVAQMTVIAEQTHGGVYRGQDETGRAPEHADPFQDLEYELSDLRKSAPDGGPPPAEYLLHIAAGRMSASSAASEYLTVTHLDHSAADVNDLGRRWQRTIDRLRARLLGDRLALFHHRADQIERSPMSRPAAQTAAFEEILPDGQAAMQALLTAVAAARLSVVPAPTPGTVLPLTEVPVGTFGQFRGYHPDGSRETREDFLTSAVRPTSKRSDGTAEMLEVPTRLLLMTARPGAMAVLEPPAGTEVPTRFNFTCRLPARDLRAGDIVAAGEWAQPRREPIIILADPEPAEGGQVRLDLFVAGTRRELSVGGDGWVTVDHLAARRPDGQPETTIAAALGARTTPPAAAGEEQMSLLDMFAPPPDQDQPSETPPAAAQNYTPTLEHPAAATVLEGPSGLTLVRHWDTVGYGARVTVVVDGLQRGTISQSRGPGATDAAHWLVGGGGVLREFGRVTGDYLDAERLLLAATMPETTPTTVSAAQQVAGLPQPWLAGVTIDVETPDQDGRIVLRRTNLARTRVMVDTRHPDLNTLLSRGVITAVSPGVQTTWHLRDCDANDLGQFEGTYADAEAVLLAATAGLDEPTDAAPVLSEPADDTTVHGTDRPVDVAGISAAATLGQLDSPEVAGNPAAGQHGDGRPAAPATGSGHGHPQQRSAADDGQHDLFDMLWGAEPENTSTEGTDREPVRTADPETLAAAPSGPVRADQRPGDVLRRAGADSGGTDSGLDGFAGRAGSAGGELHGQAGPDQHGPDERRGRGDAGDAAAAGDHHELTDPAAAGQPLRFRPGGQHDLAPSGVLARIRANLAALRTLRAVQAERRPATGDEQAVLARWSGWGAIPAALDDQKPQYAWVRRELAQLLDEREMAAAKRTVINAHYTDAGLVQVIWDAVTDLGFAGGQVLEPGCGSGNFLACAPSTATLTGVELDPSTAAIAAALYPHATILAESFADTRVATGGVDLTIGNVPFGAVRLHDKRDNPSNHTIHNHFILKSLRATRPGGLVAVITSAYTLDAVNPAARREMQAMGDLVGAVRLPSRAHAKAAGTDALTDVLIFRRRGDLEPAAPFAWEYTRQVDVDGVTLPINSYFAEQPHRVLGQLAAKDGLYRGDELTVTGDPAAAPAQLRDALAAITADAQTLGLTMSPRQDPAPAPPAAALPRSVHRPDGFLRANDDGTFSRLDDGQWESYTVPKAHAPELRALLQLRDTAVALLEAEAASLDDSADIDRLRAELDRRYQAYTGRHEAINRFTDVPALRKDKATGKMKPAVDEETGEPIMRRQRPPAVSRLRADPFAPVVLALEIFDAETQTAAKADIFTQRVVARRAPRLGADTPAEALAICLDEHGEVRLDVIGWLLGVTPEQARTALGTLVFDDPATRRLEPAAAYLSGDVKTKLAIATAAADDDPAYTVNVTALTEVVPRDLSPDEITIKMDAPWIGASYLQQFLTEILDDPTVKVEHGGGVMWSVTSSRTDTVAARSTWGTERRAATEIAQNILEQREILIKDTIKRGGDKRQVVNLDATMEAIDKAVEMRERFADWVWEDPERAESLVTRYNDLFRRYVPRDYSGTEMSLPGLATAFRPDPHQRAVVARIIHEPAVGLYHCVGGGKTADIIMGAMELRRLGMARKPAIIVPNQLIDQWVREFVRLYPQAKILAAGAEELTGNTADKTADIRRRTVARMATGDWDAVILTETAFEMLPISIEAEHAYLESELADLKARVLDAEMAGNETILKRLETKLANREERLKNRLDNAKDAGVWWELTGIDYLFRDESHRDKNLRTVSNVPGMTIPGSQRATQMDMKLAWLRERQPRWGTRATGTPIANSIVELYTEFRYLRPDLMAALGVTDIDSFLATFAEGEAIIEVTPDGGGLRNKIRHKFVNLDELITSTRVFADVKTKDQLDLERPALAERADGQRSPEMVIVEPSAELLDKVAELVQRAKDLKGRGRPEKGEDNILKIVGEGAAAALDLTLVGLHTDEPQKLDVAADNIAQIYHENGDRVYNGPDGQPHPVPGALQMVFCDLGTPSGKPGKFNAYAKLRRLVADQGVPIEKIRFIHDAANDRERAELFAACRDGRVAVLIGSTEKMGTGVNVQDRLLALHHLDCPWRPCDLEQREGRIDRRGNQNPEIRILRYSVERSLDAFRWQKVAYKARLADQVLLGQAGRETDDIGDTTLSYEEMKAATTGNPLLIEHAEAQRDFGRLERLQRGYHRNRSQLEWTVRSNRQTITINEQLVAEATAAISRRQPTSGDRFTMTVRGRHHGKRRDANDHLKGVLGLAVNDPAYRDTDTTIGEFAGFTLTARTAEVWIRTGSSVDRGMEVVLALADVPEAEVSLLPTDFATADLVTRLENRLNSLDTLITKTTVDTERRQQQIERAEHDLTKPFRHADAHAEARHRFHTLDAQVRALAAAGDQEFGTGEPDDPATAETATTPAPGAAPARPTPIAPSTTATAGPTTTSPPGALHPPTTPSVPGAAAPAAHRDTQPDLGSILAVLPADQQNWLQHGLIELAADERVRALARANGYERVAEILHERLDEMVAVAGTDLGLADGMSLLTAYFDDAAFRGPFLDAASHHVYTAARAADRAATSTNPQPDEAPPVASRPAATRLDQLLAERDVTEPQRHWLMDAIRALASEQRTIDVVRNNDDAENVRLGLVTPISELFFAAVDERPADGMDLHRKLTGGLDTGDGDAFIAAVSDYLREAIAELGQEPSAPHVRPLPAAEPVGAAAGTLPETQRRRRGHAFYPPAGLVKKIPALYATEAMPDADRIIHLHYFGGPADFWVVEYDPQDGTAFGYGGTGNPDDFEWGYFSLPELEAVNVHNNMVIIERDLHWEPVRVGDARLRGPWNYRDTAAADHTAGTVPEPTAQAGHDPASETTEPASASRPEPDQSARDTASPAPDVPAELLAQAELFGREAYKQERSAAPGTDARTLALVADWPVGSGADQVFAAFSRGYAAAADRAAAESGDATQPEQDTAQPARARTEPAPDTAPPGEPEAVVPTPDGHTADQPELPGRQQRLLQDANADRGAPWSITRRSWITTFYVTTVADPHHPLAPTMADLAVLSAAEMATVTTGLRDSLTSPDHHERAMARATLRAWSNTTPQWNREQQRALDALASFDTHGAAALEQYGRLTAQEYLALDPDDRADIDADLRAIVESRATKTIPSNRTRYGTTIRGVEADHVSGARELLGRIGRGVKPHRFHEHADKVGRTVPARDLNPGDTINMRNTVMTVDRIGIDGKIRLTGGKGATLSSLTSRYKLLAAAPAPAVAEPGTEPAAGGATTPEPDANATRGPLMPEPAESAADQTSAAIAADPPAPAASAEPDQQFTAAGPAAEPAAVDGIRVWTFASTAAAYDAINMAATPDDIFSGDVVHVPDEQVVGLVDEAWGAAVTVARGEFHEADLFAMAELEYEDSVRAARRLARDHGYPLASLTLDLGVSGDKLGPYTAEISGCSCPLCIAYAQADLDRSGPAGLALLEACFDGSHTRTVPAPSLPGAAPAGSAALADINPVPPELRTQDLTGLDDGEPYTSTKRIRGPLRDVKIASNALLRTRGAASKVGQPLVATIETVKKISVDHTDPTDLLLWSVALAQQSRAALRTLNPAADGGLVNMLSGVVRAADTLAADLVATARTPNRWQRLFDLPAPNLRGADVVVRSPAKTRNTAAPQRAPIAPAQTGPGTSGPVVVPEVVEPAQGDLFTMPLQSSTTSDATEPGDQATPADAPTGEATSRAQSQPDQQDPGRATAEPAIPAPASGATHADTVAGPAAGSRSDVTPDAAAEPAHVPDRVPAAAGTPNPSTDQPAVTASVIPQEQMAAAEGHTVAEQISPAALLSAEHQAAPVPDAAPASTVPTTDSPASPVTAQPSPARPETMQQLALAIPTTGSPQPSPPASAEAASDAAQPATEQPSQIAEDTMTSETPDAAPQASIAAPAPEPAPEPASAAPVDPPEAATPTAHGPEEQNPPIPPKRDATPDSEADLPPTAAEPGSARADSTPGMPGERPSQAGNAGPDVWQQARTILAGHAGEPETRLAWALAATAIQSGITAGTWSVTPDGAVKVAGVIDGRIDDQLHVRADRGGARLERQDGTILYAASWDRLMRMLAPGQTTALARATTAAAEARSRLAGFASRSWQKLTAQQQKLVTRWEAFRDKALATAATIWAKVKSALPKVQIVVTRRSAQTVPATAEPTPAAADPGRDGADKPVQDPDNDPQPPAPGSGDEASTTAPKSHDGATTAPATGADHGDNDTPASMEPPDIAHIRLVVIDTAAEYFGGSQGHGIAGTAAHLAQTVLKAETDRFGLVPVVQAAANVMADDDSILTRTPEQRQAQRLDRNARSEMFADLIRSLTGAGDGETALRLIGDAELHNPRHRTTWAADSNLSWDDIRDRVRSRTDQPTAAAAFAPMPGRAPASAGRPAPAGAGQAFTAASSRRATAPEIRRPVPPQPTATSNRPHR